MNNGHPLPQARTNDLVTQELPDEVLVYDLKAHKAHCLNQTAAAVWKYCDGKTSVPEMTTLMKNDFGQPVEEAAVWHAIERLGKANLLESRMTPPAGIPRLGRREALRRLGIGSAIAVPVVMSILAPTAMAGCSFGTGTQNVGQVCCTNNNCANNCCGNGECRNINQGTGTACVANCQCANGTCTGGGTCN